jgi:hypothetical protein
MAEEDRSDAWLVQVSLKTKGQTLINVRAMTVADLAERLEGIGEIAELIASTETIVGVLQPVGASRAPAAAQVAPPVAVPPAGAPPAGPSVTPPVCAHGLPAKFIPGGIGKKTNRPYTAFWACAQDQQFQCDFRQQA